MVEDVIQHFLLTYLLFAISYLRFMRFCEEVFFIFLLFSIRNVAFCAKDVLD